MPRSVLLFCGLLLACNERFEFDVPVTDSGGSGGAAGTGGAPSTHAGTAGAGAAGGTLCGTRPACPAPLRCDAGQCVECANDQDCRAESAPRCDPARRRCVTCVEEQDCAAGFTCDTLANRCLRVCGEGIECPSSAHGCDEGRGVCYQCDEDRECRSSPLGALCATDGSGCVVCRVDTDCAGKLCDPLSGRCVECRDAADCASGLCEPSLHTCLP